MKREIEANTIISEIKNEITPSSNERKDMELLSRNLVIKVENACKEFCLRAEVRLEGSVAKDTWLSGDPDIDIFIRVPTSIPRESLGEIALKVARLATEGYKQIERFAEHPYLEAFVEGIRVNIVPCYDSNPGEWKSATDRTPYHTDYINNHLKKSQRDEVRLLKKFMKGIGVYGAEIKIGGFSGYLCEILILKYEKFLDVLQTFSQHQRKRAIDVESYYERMNQDLALLFPEDLIVIDPVDKARNVASAVQQNNLHIFVAASRAFLKFPQRVFFFPSNLYPLKDSELRKIIKERNTCLIFLVTDSIDAVPDVVWGQLHRTRKNIRKQFEINDFKVLRDTVWNEGNEPIIFIFELEQKILPAVKRHLGPPLEFQKECDQFLKKYIKNNEVIVGPYLAEGRWIVQLKREIFEADLFLKDRLNMGGKTMGIGDLVARSIRRSYSVLVDEEIIHYSSKIKNFNLYLENFLFGKPSWMR
jgi:tRNA nucleotidyltransferase (CCA-adding enzyme)